MKFLRRRGFSGCSGGSDTTVSCLMASYLPEEIFSKILSRVTDLKALIRFKTVCKLWHSLISDSVFSDSVLADPHSFLQPQEIIITTVPEPSSTTKPAWSLRTQGREFKVNRFFPTLLSTTLTVVSSCNGLLLTLSGSHEICVCNPITDSYLALPSLRSHPCYSLHSFGLFLFYDISIEKYKVLGVSSRGCALLTLGDSCWRSGTSQFLVYMTGLSQLVYLWNQVHILKKGSLVSIDAATLEFSLRGLPELVGKATTLLSVVRGSLCLTNICQGIIDIFVLENRTDTIWKNYSTLELRYLSCMRDVNESWLRDRDFSISLFVMGNADTCDYSDINFLIHCRFNRRWWHYDLKRRIPREIAALRGKAPHGHGHLYAGSLARFSD